MHLARKKRKKNSKKKKEKKIQTRKKQVESNPRHTDATAATADAEAVAVDCLGERGCGEHHDHAHIATIGLTGDLASQELTGPPHR